VGSYSAPVWNLLWLTYFSCKKAGAEKKERVSRGVRKRKGGGVQSSGRSSPRGNQQEKDCSKNNFGPIERTGKRGGNRRHVKEGDVRHELADTCLRVDRGRTLHGSFKEGGSKRRGWEGINLLKNLSMCVPGVKGGFLEMEKMTERIT